MAFRPNRRQFVSTVARSAAGAVAGWSALGEGLRSRAAAADRPNVLFIAIDDLNDWIGCLGGHPDVKTPNLDALARKGMLFTRAYCSAPLCNPSRASLMTGVRPSTSGVYLNEQPWRPVLPSAVTIPQHFMAAGYEVKARGKIYHFQDPPSWQEYIPKGADPLPPGRPLNGIPNAAQFDWGPVDARDEDMDDYRVAQWGAQFLGQKHDKPFFLGCGFFKPHLPWYAPRRWFDMYPPDSVTLPNVNEHDLDDVPPLGVKMARPDGDHKSVIDTHNWGRAVSGYLACISFVDHQIGILLDAFYASHYVDNTIVVLWGDHGWHLGEKLHWRKFALWEEATHAPFMISAPGITPAGSQCQRTVSFLDIYPTLLSLCDLPQVGDGKQLEGVTMQPLLKDPAAPWDRPAVTTYQRGNHSVRSEKWRYIRYKDGTEELYDEEDDPLEWTNLASRPGYEGTKAELGKWIPTTNAPDAPTAPREQRAGD